MAFFFVLPFIHLLGHKSNYYYPSDTPSVFFLLAALWCVLEHRYLLCSLVMVLATLNRETAILIPLIPLAVYGVSCWRKHGMWTVLWLAGYIIIRLSLASFFKHNPQHLLEFYERYQGFGFRPFLNIKWLGHVENWPMLAANLGFLPLVWFALLAFVPEELKRLRFLCLVLFVAIFLAGDLYEPRVFGEIVALLYPGAVLAILSWQKGEVHAVTEGSGRQWRGIRDWAGTLTLGFIGVIGFLLWTVTPNPGLAYSESNTFEGCFNLPPGRWLVAAAHNPINATINGSNLVVAEKVDEGQNEKKRHGGNKRCFLLAPSSKD